MEVKPRSQLRNITEPNDYIPKVLSFNAFIEIIIPDRTIWSDDNPRFGRTFIFLPTGHKWKIEQKQVYIMNFLESKSPTDLCQAAEWRRILIILEARIRLCCLPGNSDMNGNVKADELERMGSLMKTSQTPYILLSTISLLRKMSSTQNLPLKLKWNCEYACFTIGGFNSL